MVHVQYTKYPVHLYVYIYVRHALVPVCTTILTTALPTCAIFHILAGVRLKKRNMIKFPNKNKIGEDFEDISQVLLYGSSDNMAYLVKYSNYVYINKTDTITLGYYLVKYI